MNKTELAFVDKLISQQISLFRLAAGERKRFFDILLQAQKELKTKLFTDLSDYGKAQVKKTLDQCTAIINAAYGGMQAELDLSGVAQHEAAATAKSFTAIGIDAAMPTAAVMKALVSETLLSGAPLSAWWAKQGDDLSFRFTSAVRQGVVQNENLQQIIRRVFGSARLGLPGIGFPAETLRRNASTLVHDSIMQIAGDARMATYKANSDIMKGYRHLSTLDSHTSLGCVARSGAQWDMNFRPVNGTTLPFAQTPIHPNCRSMIMPRLLTYRELGLDRDEIPVGTRASDEGQVRADITMTEWLKSKPKAYVDDLLGPGRAKLFQDGKITLRQLVDGSGRELTLEELKAL